jgi:hypothetical protein
MFAKQALYYLGHTSSSRLHLDNGVSSAQFGKQQDISRTLCALPGLWEAIGMIKGFLFL